MKTGIEIIKEERDRQINTEGFGNSRDDAYHNGELADAASCYAATGDTHTGKNFFDLKIPRNFRWPWNEFWWKPTTRIRDLAKAGALIAAEIDRIQRLD